MKAQIKSENNSRPGSPWTLVVAIARNGVIGRGSQLPWRLRRDLQRFKRLTMGHCLLMGRKTYDSIGQPLPGRQTLVLSREAGSQMPASVRVVQNLADVDTLVESGRRVMVVGGAQVYRLAIELCRTIWLTRVLADIEGDVLFPEMDWSRWRMESSEYCEAGPKDEWPTEFQVWTRR